MPKSFPKMYVQKFSDKFFKIFLKMYAQKFSDKFFKIFPKMYAQKFSDKFPPARLYLGLHVYCFLEKNPPCTSIPSCTFIGILSFLSDRRIGESGNVMGPY